MGFLTGAHRVTTALLRAFFFTLVITLHLQTAVAELPLGVISLGPAAVAPKNGFSCGEVKKGSWVPGRLIDQGAFYPHRAEVSALKRSLNSASENGEKKRLERSIRSLQKRLSARSAQCKQVGKMARGVYRGPMLLALQGFNPFVPTDPTDDLYTDSGQGALQGTYVILWGRFSSTSKVVTTPSVGVIESFAIAPALNQINVKLNPRFTGSATFSVLDSRGRSAPRQIAVLGSQTPVGVYLDIEGQSAISLTKTYDGEYISLYSNELFNEYGENVLLPLAGSVRAEGIQYQGKNQINVKLQGGEVVGEPRLARIAVGLGGSSNRPLIQPTAVIQVLPQPTILRSSPSLIESCGERTAAENIAVVTAFNKSESKKKFFCDTGVTVEVLPGEERSLTVVVPFEKEVRCQIGSRSVIAVPHRRRTSCSTPVAPPSLLGAYNWYGRLSEEGGAQPDEIFSDNAALLAAVNAQSSAAPPDDPAAQRRGVIQSVRIAFESNCEDRGAAGALPTLLERLDKPHYQRVFADPNYRTIMMTAYESAARPSCNPVDHRFSHLNEMSSSSVAEATKAEVYEFVRELYRRYGSEDRTIILSHWEGDNSLYCGAYYSYLTDPSFRQSCDQSYSFYYGGNSGPEETVQAMGLWFAARQVGLDQARREFPDAALRVVHAPEVASVFLLQQQGLPNLLHSHLMSAPESYDMVSFSAWEWIGSQTELAPYLAEIGNVATGKPIILGEIGSSCSAAPSTGISREQSEAQCVQETSNQAQAIEAARDTHNLVGAYIWGISGEQYGIFREDGTPRVIDLFRHKGPPGNEVESAQTPL